VNRAAEVARRDGVAYGWRDSERQRGGVAFTDLLMIVLVADAAQNAARPRRHLV
jgi:hypothetical protein